MLSHIFVISDQPPTDGERDATSTEFHQNILRMNIGSLTLVLAIIVISVVVKIRSKCGKNFFVLRDKIIEEALYLSL